MSSKQKTKSKTDRKLERAQHHRQFQNTNAVNQLQNDLNSRLFSEHSTISDAIKSISISSHQLASCIIISTRGIGLLLAQVSEYLNIRYPNLYFPINALYRISLLQLESKMSQVYQHQNLPVRDPYPRSEAISKVWQSECCAITNNLRIIAAVINSVGNFILKDYQYYPRLMIGDHVPSIRTLYTYVQRLSNVLSPIAFRRIAHEYSSIPGASWRVDDHLGPIIENPQEIIPRLIDQQLILEDVITVRDFLRRMTTLQPNFTGPVTLSDQGSPSQLVSKLVEHPIRCSFSRLHQHSITVGDYTQFHSPSRLDTSQKSIGIVSLSGEHLQHQNNINVQNVRRCRGLAASVIHQSWRDTVSALFN